VMVVPSPLTPPVTSSRLAAQHQAVRVAVLNADTTKQELLVKLLSEGESAPPGAAEAMLVALDPQRKLVF
jgi:hypothetical protein